MHAITHTQKSLNLRFKIGKNFLRQIHPCASLCLFCVCVCAVRCVAVLWLMQEQHKNHIQIETQHPRKKVDFSFSSFFLRVCVCGVWVGCRVATAKDTRTNRNTKIHTSTHKNTSGCSWFSSASFFLRPPVFGGSIESKLNAFRTRDPYLGRQMYHSPAFTRIFVQSTSFDVYLCKVQVLTDGVNRAKREANVDVCSRI